MGACLGCRVPRGLPPPATWLSHLGAPKSVPAEEAHFINTKQLKFLLARSRWQVGCTASWRGDGLGAEAAGGQRGK